MMVGRSVWPQVHVPRWGYVLQTKFADRRRRRRRKPHKSGQGAKSFFFSLLFIAIVFHTLSFCLLLLPSCLRFVGTLFRHFFCLQIYTFWYSYFGLDGADSICPGHLIPHLLPLVRSVPNAPNYASFWLNLVLPHRGRLFNDQSDTL